MTFHFESQLKILQADADDGGVPTGPSRGWRGLN